MKNKEIFIVIDGKPARSLMLRLKAKRLVAKYGPKIDQWFVTGGHWMSDEELERFKERLPGPA